MKTQRLYIALLTICLLAVVSPTAIWGENATGNILSAVSTSGRAGHNTEICINLKNSTDIVALQFALQLPKGITMNGQPKINTDRLTSHEVQAKSSPGGKCTIICWSVSNKAFEGNNGTIVTIPIAIEETVEEGMHFPIVISEALAANAASDNVLTEIQNGEIRITKSPDLVPSSVDFTSLSVKPGESMDLTWSVINNGETSTTGGWQEEIYLISKQIRQRIGTAYNSDTLAPGESMVRSAHLQLSQTPGIDGDCSIEIKLIPDRDCGEPYYLQSNNSATSAKTVNIGKILYADIPSLAVEEGVTQSRLKFTRSGATTEALSLNLSHNLDSRFSIPATCIIPAGKASAVLTITCSGNDKADRENIFTLSADAHTEGYAEVSTQIIAIDDTNPKLILQADSETIVEGEKMQVRIITEFPPKEDLTVSISNDYPSRLFHPENAVIKAGETETTFFVENPANDSAEGDIETELLATATGWESEGLWLSIKDDDIPMLYLTLSHSGVGEDAGALAATGTVTRSGNLNEPITIAISDDAHGELFYYPERITIPAGKTSADFQFGPIDNTLAEGDRNYTISAYVILKGCSCAVSEESRAGRVTAPFEVWDNDGAKISIGLSSTSVKEGNTIDLTVARNTPTASALPLTIKVAPEDVLSIRTPVEIPAGEKSMKIQVTALKNHSTGDTREVTVTIEADGHSKGSVKLAVTDNSLPDAIIESVHLSNNKPIAREEITAEIAIHNSGTRILPEATKVNVYLSHTSMPYASCFLSSPIEPGESGITQIALKAPDAVGVYPLYAVVNPDRDVQELIYDNNTRTAPQVTVESPYQTTVDTDKKIYFAGDNVTISGRLTGTFKAGDEVQIWIRNNGARQTLTAEVEENGCFKTYYKPYDYQYGHFEIAAGHPGENIDKAMASFEIPALERSSYNNITHSTIPGVQVEGTIKLLNKSDMGIDNVTLNLKGIEGITFAVDADKNEIESNGTLTLSYRVSTDRVSPSKQWETLMVTVEAAGCPSVEIPIYFYCRRPNGDLVSNLGSINTSIVKGGSKSVELKISNNGGGESGEISFSAPEWMSITPARIPSLKSGDTSSALITMTVDGSVGSRHSGQMYVNATNSQPLSIPFSVEVAASGNGTVTVDVCDNKTYATYEGEPGPHVANANIELRNRTTCKVVAQGKSDINGLWSQSIPEGNYTLTVSAENHKTNQYNITIDPGKETKQTANIILDAVTTNYEVVPTKTEDLYTIEVTTKYETQVPMPVVITEQLDDLDGDSMVAGESRIVRFRLHNVGLMRTEKVTFTPGEAEGWTIKPLIPLTPFPLEADESRIIPFMITLNDNNSPSGIAGKMRSPKSIMTACMENFIQEYAVICGTDLIDNQTVYNLALRTCASAAIYAQVMGGVTGGAISNVIQQILPQPPALPIILDPEDVDTFIGSYFDTYQDLESIRHRTMCDPEMAERAERLIGAAGTASGSFVFSMASYANDGMTLAQDQAELAADPGNIEKTEQLNEDIDNIAHGIANSIREIRDPNYERASRIRDYVDLIQAIYEFNDQWQNGQRHAIKKSQYSWANEFEAESKLIEEELMNLDAYHVEFLGDTVWTGHCDQEYLDFFDAISNRNTDGLIPIETAIAHKPSYITTQQAATLAERLNNAIINNNRTENCINFDRIRKLSELIAENEANAAKLGFQSAWDRYLAARDRYAAMLDLESQSVCASVSLKFSQKMAMTREAFRGTLTVSNGHTSKAVKNLKFQPTVRSTEGEKATSKEFQINVESATGFEGTQQEGDGLDLASMQSGTITVVYIPSRYAAPQEATPWLFSGNLTYLDPFTDELIDMEMPVVTLPVHPSPLLMLDYFIQRDIFGDDPFTEDVEPSKESEFSLMITNRGDGEATNIRLSTQQPEIVDNRKGLKIEFQLTGGAVDGEEKILPLNGNIANNVGNILPGMSRTIQWWLESNLHGHFIDYDASYTHATSFDNPDLSLVEDVKAHELIRSLYNADGKILFLSNEIEDSYDTPDRIWAPGRNSYDVALADGSIKMISEDVAQLSITAEEDGWVYGNVKDPTYSTRIISRIVRNTDGKEINSQNFWQTDRTLRDGHEALYENKLHFADSVAAGTTTYILHFEQLDYRPLKVVQFMDLPENGMAKETLQTVGVQFNRSVATSQFREGAVKLLHENKDVTTSFGVTAINATTIEINFSEAIDAIIADSGNVDGTYQLQIFCANIGDGKAEEVYSATWTVASSNSITITAIANPPKGGEIDAYSKTLSFGDEVQFTATPKNGWLFAGWEQKGEIISHLPTISIIALANDSITANFQRNYYEICVDSLAGGRVEGIRGYAPFESELTFTAIPNDGYEFEQWIIDGKPSPQTSDTMTLTVKADIRVAASFRQVIFTHSQLLETGWNWISTFIEEADLPVRQFGKIYSNEFYSEESEVKILAGRMAKVKTSFPTFLSLNGRKISGNKNVALQKGANWIGAVNDYPVELNLAFSGVQHGDIIAGQEGFAEYTNGRWIGSLKKMQPGRGYIYYSNEQHEINLRSGVRNEEDEEEIPNEARASAKAMHLTFCMKLSDGTEITHPEHLTITALNSREEICGKAILVDGVWLSTLFCKDGETISLCICDYQKEEKYVSITPIEFNEGVAGNRKQPLVIEISQYNTAAEVINTSNRVTVTTLDGIVLLKDADPNELKKLAKGIYIINSQICLK